MDPSWGDRPARGPGLGRLDREGRALFCSFAQVKDRWTSTPFDIGFAVFRKEPSSKPSRGMIGPMAPVRFDVVIHGPSCAGHMDFSRRSIDQDRGVAHGSVHLIPGL